MLRRSLTLCLTTASLTGCTAADTTSLDRFSATGELVALSGAGAGAANACVTCHGLQGQGDGAGAPRLAGLDAGEVFLHPPQAAAAAQRGAEPPATLQTDPLVYQGGSGVLLGPTDDIPLAEPAWGCDFESEVCVILGDTPQGVRKGEASRYVRLVMLANDVSLRNLIPAELAKGFGFFNSKPATAFSPFAVTPDELGDAWRDGRARPAP